jgi:hypothetical protein
MTYHVHGSMEIGEVSQIFYAKGHARISLLITIAFLAGEGPARAPHPTIF